MRRSTWLPYRSKNTPAASVEPLRISSTKTASVGPRTGRSSRTVEVDRLRDEPSSELGFLCVAEIKPTSPVSRPRLGGSKFATPTSAHVEGDCVPPAKVRREERSP